MHDSSAQVEPEFDANVTAAPLAAQEAVAATSVGNSASSLFWMRERLLRYDLSARPGTKPEQACVLEETAGFDLSQRNGVLKQNIQRSGLSGATLARAIGEIAPAPQSAAAGLGADLCVMPQLSRPQEALVRIWSSLQNWPDHISHLSLSAVMLDGIRGCCPAPEQGHVWPLRHRGLRLQAVRSDGSILVREWLYEIENADDTALETMTERLKKILRNDPAHCTGPNGTLPLVSGAGQGAVIFHELIGHLCEADQLARAIPELAQLDNLPHDLVIKDRHDPAFGPGHLPVDDEGCLPRNITLCAEGKLRDCIHDRETAQTADQTPTGNGRRQDYRHSPEPRMRNLCVDPGSASRGALFDGIKEGLWLDQCGPAWMDAGADRFAIKVEAGHMIRNGRIAEPVRGVTVSGTVTGALSGIMAIGAQTRVSDQVVPCGKGGILRTGIAGPAARFKPLDIS